MSGSSSGASASRSAGFRKLFRRNQGVRARSTIVGTVLLTVALAIGAAVMLVMLDRTNNRTMYNATNYHAYELAEMIRSGGVASIPANELVAGSGGADMIQVVDAHGRIVAASPNAPAVPLSDANPAGGGASSISGPMVPGDDTTYCGTVVTAVFGDQQYRVIAVISAEPFRQSLLNTAIILAIELPILIGLAAIAIYYFAGRAMRPVGRITSQVNAITSSDLSRRVPVPTTDDEITRLATTMNEMLDRLDRGRHAQLRFIGDASHEMRSPLTTIVGMLDLADCTDSAIDLDTVRTILLPEAQRMQKMVEDLLLLARADESGLGLTIRDVDLDDLVTAEVRRIRSLGLATVTATIMPIRVSGDPEKLGRALRNLTENAIAHASTTVGVHMSVDPEGGLARISVADDGPGIPLASRTAVFERFTRLRPDRRTADGCGLGLSIVHEIVRAHGGTVEVVGPSPGFTHGATFVITLDVPDAPSDESTDTSTAGRPASESSTQMARRR
ncbi:HAMP domain-containing sensor histidine kinase [Gordonia sp. ABSL1-1]|uniref:sensor histidine kinase n=1 Tax=Gordonia sp. ABSL1-1 TaxID=3053923 RepID=UPI0025729C68|nr:HAMP domain-containing sensor histidine kinase [Gordonia sp. ABSL1-1]MDL9937987.1 HAMP domain-containing sensor histidine kinase [Gordonia sp. ABSL1-1]